MTTTTPPTNQMTTDQRRTRKLRWLLKVASVNNLPMPRSIEFGEFTLGGTVHRYVQLRLDNDIDVTDWAKAINADDVEELEVTGDTNMWTSVRAFTRWDWQPRVDWHRIEVTSYHNYRPLTGDPAVTS
jgi:hypothetical protein